MFPRQTYEQLENLIAAGRDTSDVGLQFHELSEIDLAELERQVSLD